MPTSEKEDMVIVTEAAMRLGTLPCPDCNGGGKLMIDGYWSSNDCPTCGGDGKYSSCVEREERCKETRKKKNKG